MAQKTTSKSLNDEIMNYCHDIEESLERKNAKMEVLRGIESIVLAINPDAKIMVMGSSGNGFQTNEGDMDLTVVYKMSYYSFGLSGRSGASTGYNKSELGFLRELAESLEMKRDSYRHIEVVSAKVPITKFENVKHSIPCDISVNNMDGVLNAVLLKAYSQVDFRLKPLFFAIKKWAKSAGIIDPRNFRLASFVLQLMVIHYLQSGCDPRVLPSLQKLHPSFFAKDVTKLADYISTPLPADVTEYQSRNNQNVADLLLGFFNHYCTYDWGRDGISVREGANVCRPAKWGSNNTCLYVEDPFSRSNTARSVFKYGIWCEIKEEFNKAKRLLDSGRGYRELLRSYGVYI